MSKTVTIRHTNGETKKVVLGKEQICISAEPRGWGSECKTLVKKKDGFYHCGDCGLVFKKLVQKTKLQAIWTACDCRKLVNFLEWFFDECHGYDCPESYYQCSKCGRVYQSPYYSREAPLRLQESEAAQKHVQHWHDYQKKELAERIDGALEGVWELNETLRQVPKAAKQRILRELAK